MTKRTSGVKKLQNHFLEVVSSDEFKNDFANLFEKLDSRKDSGDLTEFYRKEIRLLAHKYGLISDTYREFLSQYLMSNKPDNLLNETVEGAISSDLCVLSDPMEDAHNMTMLQEVSPKAFKHSRELYYDRDAFFPVSIKVSPYASIRDIRDFIAKNSEAIKKLQDKYKDPSLKIGKVKTRRQRAVYQFAYDNKDGSRNELYSDLRKRFPGEWTKEKVAKIISLEKKRRKKV